MFKKKFIIFKIASSKNFMAIDQKEAINKYIVPQMMRENYKKQKESINLMGLQLSNKECEQVLAVGTRSQKETVKNLFLADKKLDRLPFKTEQFPHVRWLTLSRNQIKQFEGIDKLPQLKNLILTSTSLSVFQQLFYDCTSLQELSMPFNYIQNIDARISNLKNLQSLELTSNWLYSLPEELFDCINLKYLKMKGNKLTAISDNIAKLINLQVLVFASNNLTSITDRIGDLPKLRQIFISNNHQLFVLPDSLRNLHNITMFDISYTQINSIPIPEQGWPKLRLLNIEGSKVVSPPKNLLQGENLEILIINKIPNFEFQKVSGKALKTLEAKFINASFFPQTIAKMTNLQTINMTGNQVTNIQSAYLPQSLQNLIFSNCQMKVFPILGIMRKLKKLDLSSNKNLALLPNQGMEFSSLEEFLCTGSNLQQLSPCMLKWEKMKKLQIRMNRITQFFDQQTETRVINQKIGWPNLIYLNINSNQLQAIPEVILNSLQIEQIYASQNQIKWISSSIKNLKQLKQIKMERNLIQLIPPQLAQLKNINILILSQNNLKIVPIFLKDLPKLRILGLDHMEIKEVQCEDWVLNETNIAIGNLKNITQKLKLQREQVKARLQAVLQNHKESAGVVEQKTISNHNQKEVINP